MLTIMKNKLDPADLDIVLARDLCSEDEDFYSLTLKTALDEILQEEYLEACQYSVGFMEGERKLLSFIGWTKTKVIFALNGLFYEDSLLSSVPRNYKVEDRFTI